MSRPSQPDARAHHERMVEHYRRSGEAVLAEIEREVLGCDYGATSWTDRGEADAIAAALGLGPGVRALELGAGSGWPALYLASTTGCDVVLSDLPLDGLRVASARIARDALGDRCRLAVADGAALPLADASIDAVFHCDVLC